LKTATKRILWGKVVNAGQTCVAPDYVLVPKDFQDEFVEALKETCVLSFVCLYVFLPIPRLSCATFILGSVSIGQAHFTPSPFPLVFSLARNSMLTLNYFFPVMRNSTLTPINAPLPQVLSVVSLHPKPLLVLPVFWKGLKEQLYLEARSIRQTSILHRLLSRMSGLVTL
jgi:Aldehyde dehydrogenase family